MFQGEFESRRRSLRLEQGDKFSNLWVLSITRIIVYSSLDNTSKQTSFKYGIRVQYEGCQSSGQRALTTSRSGI